jgi:N-carbamoylputrescine amidase
MLVLTAGPAQPLSRTTPSQRASLRVALVQHRWRADTAELTAVLNDGIARAADAGARAVFLPEITLLRYPADTVAGPNPGPRPNRCWRPDLRAGRRGGPPAPGLRARLAVRKG